MKKALSVFLSLLLFFQPVLARANVLAGIDLPPVGEMVHLSSVFQPALLRGMTIDPAHPLRFDFILDPGASSLSAQVLRDESQRMINYFLAALTIPQQDLWVNLSPVEKDRIVPDALIKTELGRDLLGQDYILKQLTASLIYPEDGLGKAFWKRVYDEAYTKFGVTDVPVDAVNKVWIMPERASVFEKNNTVYITKVHLKVMLEADYQARALNSDAGAGKPVEELSKQVLREVIVPAIEKEVNEGKNFVRLRQVVYSLVLAQWYQDVLKESVLNKVYSGQSKVAGIDLSDPQSKQRIYEQYLAAYRQGVFNYIKEDVDRVSHEPMPKKYFSGGFGLPEGGRISRDQVHQSAMALGAGHAFKVRADAEPANAAMESNPALEAVAIEPHDKWSALDRPLAIMDELNSLWPDGVLNREGLVFFLEKYSRQVAADAVKFRVQATWPVLKAVTMLSKEQADQIIQVINEEYGLEQRRPVLVNAILLMNDIITPNLLQQQAPHLVGKKIYVASSEIHLFVGGLGPVMLFDLFGFLRLGAKAEGLEPGNQLRRDKGNPLGDPVIPEEIGIKDVKTIYEDTVEVGDKDGRAKHTVRFRVERGIDKNGAPTNLVRDVQDTVAEYQFRVKGLDYQALLPTLLEKGYLENAIDPLTKDHRVSKDFNGLQQDFKDAVGRIKAGYTETEFKLIEEILLETKNGNGPSYYTRMPYNYGGLGNPVTKEESIAFINNAFAKFIQRHPPDIVLANDGQLGPLQAVTLSKYGDDSGVKKIEFGFRSHTYDRNNEGNRGERDGPDGILPWFYGHMLGIDAQYQNAARRLADGLADDTSLGLRMAGAFGGFPTFVSDAQGIDMGPIDEQYADWVAVTNGAVPELTGRVALEEFKRLFPAGDFRRPTSEQIETTKKACVVRLNGLKIQTANGRFVEKENARLRAEWELKGRLGKLEQLGAPHGGVVNVDPDALLVAIERRLVSVKFGQEGAFSEAAIWRAMELGYTILLAGNHQGTSDSKTLEAFYRDLEWRIAEAQVKEPKKYPGKFFFTDAFTPEQKVTIEAAKKVGPKPSKKGGAAEVSEELNWAAYDGGAPNPPGRGQGVILAQGTPVDFKRPGRGFVLAPSVNTPEAWIREVWEPVMELWRRDVHHSDFFKNAEVSARQAWIQHYLITSMAMLEYMDSMIARKEKEAAADGQMIEAVTASLKGNREAQQGISVKGRNGVDKPFVFDVFNGGKTPADEKGLEFFIKTMREMQQGKGKFEGKAVGFEAFLYHYTAGHYEGYLSELFSGLPALEPLRAWMNALKAESAPAVRKLVRMERMMERLQQAISAQLRAEPAMETKNAATKSTGGIDARNIGVDRAGDLMPGVVSDKALEKLLSAAPGVRAPIVSVTPIADLRSLLGLAP